MRNKMEIFMSGNAARVFCPSNLSGHQILVQTETSKFRDAGVLIKCYSVKSN